MRASRLIVRGLTYYWRTNIAVVLGVATAVAVLAGALLVGDSVRASLRDLAISRLGRTDQIVVSETFFREQLARDVTAHPSFKGAFVATTPLVIVRGVVTDQESGRRAGQVRVYGVDDRFWEFHGLGGTKVPPPGGVAGPADRQAFVSPALAREIGAAEGRAVLVRVERPSDIPLDSLHSRKDDVGRTIRLTVAQVLPREALGEFSLEPQQGDVRAVFVPLSRLQAELEVGARVNALLVSGSGALDAVVYSAAVLEDFGLSVRIADNSRAVIVSATGGLIDDGQVDAINRVLDGGGIRGQPVFTYLANTLAIGDRQIPYSLVTATDLQALTDSLPADTSGATQPPPIVLNEWAARDLQAKPGDALTMDFYVWVEPGRIQTGSLLFRVAGVVPIAAGGRDLVPTYPGMTEAASIDDWDPPFPVDLSRIRKVDEDYWDAYRTTPKAFIPIETGRRLWSSRYGSVTSLRVPVAEGADVMAMRDRLETELRAALDPAASGLVIKQVRAESLDASRGATDFGEYFVYFSFFLVVSALLLAALFFKLGVEQRGREVGLLRAVGYGAGGVRRLFLGEGVLLAVTGSALGIAGGIGYAWLIMTALRTWWVDAVGTTALTLHITPVSLAAGAAGGVAAAIVCIWWTLRSLRRISERSLLAGQITFDPGGDSGVRARRLQMIAALLALAGLALVGAGASGRVAANGAFFGAGALLLAGSLCLFAGILRRPARTHVAGIGWRPVTRLGLRAATHRPGRSVLSAAVIASATFMLISVDAFRRGSVEATSDRSSGVGGYQILVETLLPIVHDPNDSDGRVALGLTGLGDATHLEPFRLLPGDDASCLNLYAPKNPRILGARDAFLAERRFTFASSLATTDAERDNPWLLLKRSEPDGAIPVIADANSMTYVLHRAVGDEFVLDRGGEPIRLRFVAALRDSVFQGELVMAESNFVRLFPDQQGINVLLAEAPTDDVAALAATIEESLADLGADATATADRLAAFHRVENTYLSTFQTLGGLGLLLGTVGLATVLLRNALERRKELALLSAVGYRRGHFGLMALAENALLLGVGLAAGAASASLAIAPAIAERGGRLPLTAGGALLLFAVFVIGLVSSAVATRAVTRAPLLASLRSE